MKCRVNNNMLKAYYWHLKEKGIDVAIASRSRTPEIASTFLDKLGIRSMFVAETFSSRTEVPFSSMLYFDDENRNIEVVYGNGVNLRAARQGMLEFLLKSKSSTRSRRVKFPIYIYQIHDNDISLKSAMN